MLAKSQFLLKRKKIQCALCNRNPSTKFTKTTKCLYKFELQIMTLGYEEAYNIPSCREMINKVLGWHLCMVIKLVRPAPSETHLLFIVSWCAVWNFVKFWWSTDCSLKKLEAFLKHKVTMSFCDKVFNELKFFSFMNISLHIILKVICILWYLGISIPRGILPGKC